MAAKTQPEYLQKIQVIVWSDREQSYGHPSINFLRIKILWDAWDEVKDTVPQEVLDTDEFKTADVTVRNILQKIARVANTPMHEDSWIDIGGYAGAQYRIITDS